MIIDSDMTRDEALAQNPASPCPEYVISHLCLVDVEYRGFDGRPHCGQIVVHEHLVAETILLFMRISCLGFPVGSVIPISHPRFAWDDEASIAANNSSGFNYRRIAGSSRLSYHATGRAIDINPVQNPIITTEKGWFGRKKRSVLPYGAVYDPNVPGTFKENGPLVGFMESIDWQWGGGWDEPKDYHHFQKP